MCESATEKSKNIEVKKKKKTKNIEVVCKASEEKTGYTPVSPVRIRAYCSEFEILVAH